MTLLLSEVALHSPSSKKVQITTFSTTQNLGEHLKSASVLKVKAIFHAAAVSDFCIKRPVKGKISSDKELTIQLKPSPKLIRNLHKSHPDAFIVGWKYEISGNRESTEGLARHQVNQCKTNLCVANGPAYGNGFGVVGDEVIHCPNKHSLFRYLIKQVTLPR